MKRALAGISGRELARSIDATQLKPAMTLGDAERLVEDVYKYGFHCAMLPPAWIRSVRSMSRDMGVRLCSVSGFPSGGHPLNVKALEIEYLASMDVEEVDIVPLFGGDIEEELGELVDRARSGGIRIVKVILEAPLHGDESLARMVEAAARAGADFVKTSTGVYSKGGDPHTVYRLYRIASKYGLKVKAAGGIRDRIQAVLALAAGASRIGTSSYREVLREPEFLGGMD
ncbi:MAG: 2-deoxyribose-5-phosphate aldolase [Desulfurococcales archaeon]|nr:2-deoxyribose-5-phosphate aldolase [Desulfurococcales archaeon]